MSTPDTARPATIDAATVRDLTVGGRPPRLVDVRTPAEFAAAHIPGAYNVPLDLVRKHRADLLPHLGDDVVLVCRTGVRAAQAGQALAAPGVRVLDGGLMAWRDAGAPVAEGRPRWDLERQVRLVAGSIVLASILASVFVPALKWVAAAIGAGLTVAALTNTCTMGMLLSKLPYNRGARCDLDSVIRLL